MNWYTVDSQFLNKLRIYENRIPHLDYGENKLKPFFGKLFEVKNLVYITQVSHPKIKHNKLKENLDFLKLYDDKRLLAVVNLNYMFPIPKDKLIKVEYKNIELFRTFKDDIEKGKYIYLLKKEMKSLNRKNISDKAINLYKFKYNFPNHIVSKRCFDFKLLEEKCLELSNVNT